MVGTVLRYILLIVVALDSSDRLLAAEEQDHNGNQYSLTSANFLTSEKELTSSIDVVPDIEIVEPGIIPPGGNLWALSIEEDWHLEEYLCAVELARKQSGNENLVFPFQDFRECLQPRHQEGVLVQVWREVENRLRKQGIEILESDEFVSPISGRAQYRGWYYCYINRKICGGRRRNQVAWWQGASRWKSRGGRHLGLDIIEFREEVSEISRIRAVANGVVYYSNTNLEGWGHALLLAFKKGGQKYLAVYAHLPETSRKWDGKVVEARQSLGVTGCSGNAGNTKGQCNNHCDVGKFFASDMHLHYEILRVTKKEKKPTPVNPLKVIPFKVEFSSKRRLVTCQKK